MFTMKNVKDIKPDWTNRRKVIKALLFLLGVLVFITPVGVAALALFGKFTFHVAMFFIIFNSFTFVSILGITGSYVFGARWETKDFLNAITNLVPDFNHKEDVVEAVEEVLEPNVVDTPKP